MTATDGAQFHVNQTVMVAPEQMLVTGIADVVLSVSRGLNGTAGAFHADWAAVYILRWPASVERATLIQVARLWTRAADFEPFFVDSELDTDVRLLLEPYRKLAGVRGRRRSHRGAVPEIIRFPGGAPVLLRVGVSVLRLRSGRHALHRRSAGSSRLPGPAISDPRFPSTGPG